MIHFQFITGEPRFLEVSVFHQPFPPRSSPSHPGEQPPAGALHAATPSADYQMTAMMMNAVADNMRRSVSTAVEAVMDSGMVEVAMIVSAIVFTQRSILNYTYFLNNVRRLLEAAGLGTIG